MNGLYPASGYARIKRIHAAHLIQEDVLIGCPSACLEEDRQRRQIISQLPTERRRFDRILILPSERLAAPLKNVKTISGARPAAKPAHLEGLGGTTQAARGPAR
ncbi:MAG: hypothetical protein WCC03_10455 [Candidatus Acidiferrales bacterium]